MKATGIVRRIDDLGRVVIPREVRRTLKIHEGDPLEIFTTREGEIVLKRYQPMELTELGEMVDKLTALEIEVPQALQDLLDDENRRLEE